MSRLFVCLPICLLLAPAYPDTPLPSVQGQTQAVRSSSGALEMLAILAWAPHTPSPAALPWGGLQEVSQAILARSDNARPDRDVIAFLEKCLEFYDRQVKTGYSLVMRKQERIDDTLHRLEQIEVHFKEEPHSVYFKWLEGQRKARRVLFVKGENQDRILALPAPPLTFAGIQARDLDSTDAKASGRYSIAEFGLKKAMQRVVTHWKKARAAKTLHVAYEGIHRVPELGNRTCYKLHRTRFARPEDGGVTDLTLYIDTETLMQVGSVLRGPKGELIAQYFFRDIRLNPTFDPKQFTREALTR